MFISSLTFLRLSFLPVRAAFIACPKAAKSYKGTGLFVIIIHLTTFYCSFLHLDMSTQFLQLAKIIYILALAIIRLSVYNYNDRALKKGRANYGIYVLPRSSEKMGHFRKTGTETLRGQSNTGHFKNRLYVADTKRRAETKR